MISYKGLVLEPEWSRLSFLSLLNSVVTTLVLNQWITKLHNCQIVAHMASLIYIFVFCLLPFWCTKTRTSPQWVSDEDDCALRLFTAGINICLVDLITKGLQTHQFTPGNNKYLHVSLNYFPCPLYKQVKRQGAYLGSLPDITLQKALAWCNFCVHTRTHKRHLLWRFWVTAKAYSEHKIEEEINAFCKMYNMSPKQEIPKNILRKSKTSEQLLYEVGYRVTCNNYTSYIKRTN